MYKILILVSLLTVGCAGSGGSSGGGTASVKSLASNWTRSDNTLSLNLTNIQIGVPLTFNFTFTSGAICQCSITVTGLEASGNYTVSSCNYTGGGSGNPGCASLNSTGTYSKPASQLSICDPGCATYN